MVFKKYNLLNISSRLVIIIVLNILLTLFLPGSLRIVRIENNILFLDLSLKGLTLTEAKGLVIEKIREFENERILINYENMKETFTRNMFLKIDLDKTLEDLFVFHRDPTFYYSRLDFEKMIADSKLPLIISDVAFAEVLKGNTIINITLPPMQVLKQDSLLIPIKGAIFPFEKAHLPNAPRPYRAGKHRGVDFFTGYVGVPITTSTEIYSVYDGEIIRIDHNYIDMTYQEWKNLSLESVRKGFTSSENLDKFMGRQIHIKHGNGIKTVYAHLSWVRTDLKVGDKVFQGEFIARAGNSGTGGSFTHLHFEIWIDDEYLGKGLPPEQVRELYEYYFREW
ncbi:MAG: hypothetical protein DDT23_00119 [candidate division WS2 bacterium]|nr:hypothetical protein [Candidatus Lithacetigena glycinireducens]